MHALLMGGSPSWALQAHHHTSRQQQCSRRALAQPQPAACLLGSHNLGAWVAPDTHAGRKARILLRISRGVAVQRQRGSFVLAAASPAPAGVPLGPGPVAEPKKENFVTRVLKPLRDFGFGRVSFWEGGVGLFVFAGIGARAETCLPVSLALALMCLHHARRCFTFVALCPCSTLKHESELRLRVCQLNSLVSGDTVAA